MNKHQNLNKSWKFKKYKSEYFLFKFEIKKISIFQTVLTVIK